MKPMPLKRRRSGVLLATFLFLAPLCPLLGQAGAARAQGVVAAPAPLVHQNGTFYASAVDLARRKVTLRVEGLASGILEIGSQECRGTVPAVDQLLLDCRPLTWVASDVYPLKVKTRDAERAFSFRAMEPMSRTDSVFKANAKAPFNLRFEGTNPPMELAVFAGGLWFPGTLDSQGKLLLSAEHLAPVEAALSKAGARVLVRARSDHPSREWQWEVETGQLSGTDSSSRANGIPQCPAPDPETYVLCFDTTGSTGSGFRFADGRESAILRPNRPVKVWVLHERGDRVQVNATGTRGVWEPGTAPRATTQSAETSKPEKQYEATETLLAPRRPGDMAVTVAILRAEQRVWERSVELLIESTWSGAVRSGVGFLWCPYERDYEVLTVPGSAQPEVVNAVGELAGPGVEVVIGYAPFLDRGGRGYQSPEDRSFLPGRFAPYLGLGLLSASTTQSLGLLKTAYVGAEWEFNASSSISLALALHQVEGLREGFRLGGPARTDDIVSFSTYRPGLALVLNASPDFMKIATGSK